jgi:hypothetical protein
LTTRDFCTDEEGESSSSVRVREGTGKVQGRYREGTCTDEEGESSSSVASRSEASVTASAELLAIRWSTTVRVRAWLAQRHLM